MEKTIGALAYLADRLHEPSSWIGIAAFLAAVHVNIPDGQWAAITSFGVGAAGLLAYYFPEHKRPE